MQNTTIERELVCSLNDPELRERGDAMAECELAVERLKVERRKLNAQIREQSDRRAELAEAIEARAETRSVSCQYEPDYARKVWALRRLDTRVVLEELAMSEADMQLRLGSDDQPAEPATNGKRGRGRPRKSAVVDPAPLAAAANGKRGRGRPRKSAVVDPAPLAVAE